MPVCEYFIELPFSSVQAVKYILIIFAFPQNLYWIIRSRSYGCCYFKLKVKCSHCGFLETRSVSELVNYFAQCFKNLENYWYFFLHFNKRRKFSLSGIEDYDYTQRLTFGCRGCWCATCWGRRRWCVGWHSDLLSKFVSGKFISMSLDRHFYFRKLVEFLQCIHCWPMSLFNSFKIFLRL